jgi:hypothetical protein
MSFMPQRQVAQRSQDDPGHDHSQTAKAGQQTVLNSLNPGI